MIMTTAVPIPAEFKGALRHALACFFEDLDPEETLLTFAEDNERIAALECQEFVEAEQRRVLVQFMQRVSELSDARRTYARKLLALAEKCNQCVGPNERDGTCYVTGKRVEAGKGRVVIYRATSRNERNVIDESVFRDFSAVASIIWLRRIIVAVCIQFVADNKSSETIELTTEAVMSDDHAYGRFAGTSATTVTKLFMDATAILDAISS